MSQSAAETIEDDLTAKSPDFEAFLFKTKQEVQTQQSLLKIPEILIGETLGLLENFAEGEGLTEAEKRGAIDNLVLKFNQIVVAIKAFRAEHPGLDEASVVSILKDKLEGFDRNDFHTGDFKKYEQSILGLIERAKNRKTLLDETKGKLLEEVDPRHVAKLQKELEAVPFDDYEKRIKDLNEKIRVFRIVDMVNLDRYREYASQKYENTFFNAEEANDWHIRFAAAQSQSYMKKLYAQLVKEFNTRQKNFHAFLKNARKKLFFPKDGLEALTLIYTHLGEAAYQSEPVQSLKAELEEARDIKQEIEKTREIRDTAKNRVNELQDKFKAMTGRKVPVNKKAANDNAVPLAANDNQAEIAEESPEALGLKLQALDKIPAMCDQMTNQLAKYGFTSPDKIYAFINYGSQAKVNWMKAQPSLEGGEGTMYQDYLQIIANDNVKDDKKLKNPNDHFAFNGFSLSQDNFTVAQAQKVLSCSAYMESKHPMLLLMSYAFVVDPEKFSSNSIYSANPEDVKAAAAHVRGNLTKPQAIAA